MTVTDRPALKKWLVLLIIVGMATAACGQQSHSTRGALGIIGDDSSTGIRVRAVVSKSPAAQAGLRAGDLIVRINGLEARLDAIPIQKPGTQVIISYIRERQNGQAVATVGDQLAVYSAAAKAGDAHAQGALGGMYMDGDDVEKDQVQAMKWLTAAADQAEPYALLDLALAYSRGEGITKDEARGQELFRQAVRLLKKSAENGELRAASLLGAAYVNGWGVERDDVEAVNWWRKAAEKGYPRAEGSLGWAFANGRGIAKDDMEALKWWRLAADKGDVEAQANLGGAYFNGRGVVRDDREALKWWRRAAEQGDALAQNGLGVAYSNGRGVDKDDAEALKWWRAAAEKGNSDAEDNLGWAFANGRGVSKDEAEAVRWWRAAADKGNTNAQKDLGLAYHNSRGVPHDDAEAAKWLGKAAEKGNGYAGAELGWLYVNGLGVSKDEGQGIRWFRMAAEQGIAVAQWNLGFAYFNGRSVAKDKIEALKWYSKAAEQGYSAAQDALGLIAYHNDDVVNAFVWMSLSAAAGNQHAKKDLELPRFKTLTAEQLATAGSWISAWTAYLHRTQDPTAPGEMAEKAQHPREALNLYLTALKDLPEPIPLDADERLRERIINLVAKLQPQPAIPEDANRHEVYAKLAFNQAQNPEGLVKSLGEWKVVLGLAPWWAAAYYNAAIVCEKRGDYLQAVRNLRLYLAAAPAANDANEVRQKIYALEYQANEKIN